MLRKVFIVFLLVALLLTLIGIGVYEKFFKGVAPAIFAPPKDITEFLPEDSVSAEAINETNFPLELPPGFIISIFAKNLAGARVMRFGRDGSVYISDDKAGVIYKVIYGKKKNE